MDVFWGKEKEKSGRLVRSAAGLTLSIMLMATGCGHCAEARAESPNGSIVDSASAAIVVVEVNSSVEPMGSPVPTGASPSAQSPQPTLIPTPIPTPVPTHSADGDSTENQQDTVAPTTNRPTSVIEYITPMPTDWVTPLGTMEPTLQTSPKPTDDTDMTIVPISTASMDTTQARTTEEPEPTDVYTAAVHTQEPLLDWQTETPQNEPMDDSTSGAPLVIEGIAPYCFAASGAAALLLGSRILSDIYVIRWYRRKQAQTRAKQKEKG